MLTVVILGYLVCVIVAFKVIKIKPTPVSIAVATLVGVLMVGGLLIGWKIAAPISGQMTVHRKVIQLLSNQDSKELISKIYVDDEQPVKKGDPLYETDPAPNQYTVQQLTAQLAASEQNIKQLEAGVEVAAASVEAAQANEAYKKSQLDTALTTQKLDPQAIAELEVEVLRQNYAAAQAGVEKALAGQKEADFALAAAKDAIKATAAQLATAELNLAQNVVRAPADGYVTNWQAVEGQMTTTVITSAQGAFMDTTKTWIAAVFPQNLLKNVTPGDDVEIAFKSFPGKIATGKVDAILEYSGEGQLPPSGAIPVTASLHPDRYLVVRIVLDDKELEKALPLGGAGTVAIYTKALQPLHVISKITVRIKMWTNYLPI